MIKFEPQDSLPLSAAERKLMDKTPDSERDARIAELAAQLVKLPPMVTGLRPQTNLPRANVMLELAGLFLDLDKQQDAWQQARPTVEVFIANDEFEKATLACQYVYLCEQEDAIASIGQAAWLAVTYPIDPQLTATVLDHIIDETPDDSDGAAVAAAVAHYVADVRSTDEMRQQLQFYTGAMLARVARRHSNIDSQDAFNSWVTRMELDDPEKFLVRLRNVIDVMVQMDWWFDRAELQAALPD